MHPLAQLLLLFSKYFVGPGIIMVRKLSIKSILGAIFLSVALWVYATLNTRMTALVVFPVNILLPPDRAAEGELPDAVQVKIRASGWELLNLRYVGAETQCLIDYSAKPLGSNEFFVGKNDILQGLHPAISLDKVTEIAPETFRIATGAVVEKRVAVKPQVSIIPRAGCTIVGGVAVRPDSITIRGNASLLQAVPHWKTERAELRDAVGPFAISLKLQDSLSNKISFVRLPVLVSGDIQLAAEQTFYDIPVEVVNAPADSLYRISPRRIAVTIRGGVQAVLSLSSESFKVRIDYAALKNDATGIVIPQPSSPPNVEIVNVEPRVLYHYQIIASQNTTPKFRSKDL